MRSKPETSRQIPSNETSKGLGSNLIGVSQYNERLILQLIRRSGSLPKAEIARRTNLSAQTISVIINRLLDNQLLIKQSGLKTRGKVGQPAVPIALNPDGAFSIGIKIGRHSLDVLLINFTGQVLQRTTHHYDFPDPEFIFATIDKDIELMVNSLSRRKQDRILGIGVAAPYSLGGWNQLTHAPEAIQQQWNSIDIRQRVSSSQSLPVWLLNDATAACIAELEFGKGALWSDYLYFFIGTFIGGGTVLNGSLYSGGSGNAGAVGSMPIPAIYSQQPEETIQPTVQLIHCASRYLLDNRLHDAGADPDQLLENYNASSADSYPLAIRQVIDEWIIRSADAIAVALAASISVLDFKGIIIDGYLPASLIERLTATVKQALERLDLEGLEKPQLECGSIGNDARAIGGAVIPFYHNFAPDLNVLLKMGVNSNNI